MLYWKLMGRISSSPGGPLYPLFRRSIEARYREIKETTDSKKLYGIYRRRELGWHIALTRITDPEICSTIFYTPKYQKDFNEYSTHYRLMHLLVHMPDSDERQRLLAEYIEQDLNQVREYSEASRRSIQQNVYGGTQTDNYRKRIDEDREYMAQISDPETRRRLESLASSVAANLPRPLMGPKTR